MALKDGVWGGALAREEKNWRSERGKRGRKKIIRQNKSDLVRKKWEWGGPRKNENGGQIQGYKERGARRRGKPKAIKREIWSKKIGAGGTPRWKVTTGGNDRVYRNKQKLPGG